MRKENIKIIFEDNHILVVLKPENIVVQKDETCDEDLLTILKEYIKEKYNKPGNVFLGLLHRLDRPVSGVMVFAKTSKCASRISEQIRSRKMKKKYYAILRGRLKFEEKSLIHFIKKDENKNKVEIDEYKFEEAAEAKLSYKVKAVVDSEFGVLSLVEVDLETGRPHQIRAQFSYIGNPILGDQKYSNLTEPKIPLALFAYYLSFEHPVTKEALEFSDLPENKFPWNLFEI